MTVHAVIEVALPRLSESMEQAVLIAWLKSEGERVEEGEPLVELETDKSTVVHAAEGSGVLEILVPEGETAAVGDVIARLNPAGAAPAAPAAEPAPPAPAAEPSAAPPSVPATKASPPAAPPRGEAPASNGTGHTSLSPLARRLAAIHGIDPAAVQGNGPGGMVLRGDILRAARVPDAGPPRPPAAAAEVPGAGLGIVTVVEPSRIQRIIAERMVESHTTIPDFTMRVDVDMEAAVALRGQLKALGADGAAPSINDMVVKASALALRDVPKANAGMRDGRIEQYSRVNVGIAVATSDAIIVPVVSDADRRSLDDIGVEGRRLASAVRAGTVAPEDLADGTFTVSNLGMYGLRSFTAVINPPQAAILAVGALRHEPVVRDGEIRAGVLMSLTLTGDHRILNGVDGAELLVAIAGRLESPLRIALG